jgi:hypothetical protein
LTGNWKTYCIPLSEFAIGQGVKLPQGYPEQWNYWMPPASGRGGENDGVKIHEVERLLISVRPEEGKSYQTDPQLEIAAVRLQF